MMDNREFEGKSVDHALFLASQDLGVEPEDLEFEVLQQSPGQVRIRVEPLGKGAAKPDPAGAAEEKMAESPRASTPPPRRFDPPQRQPAPREPRRDDAGTQEPWTGTPRYPNLTEMVEALVAASGLDLSVDISSEDNTDRITIEGPDAELLTGSKGEGLSALEHVISKMVLRGLGRRARIRVDSLGYRKRREEELVKMAQRSAEKVKQDGVEVSTEPLNSYERRLVHLALRDDPALMTESEGDGFLKKITIRPRPSGGADG
ncbi:MAG: Jag N-terminal domain-containing protein [Acidobacteria bacterium]|nr:Jag N-terminal domain-containing protein [Acidobacteriota bacterium]